MPASIKHLTDKKLKLASLLAKWKDGLYYTAAIVKCDRTNKRCLVCFEDGSEVWVSNKDVHLQITLDQLDDADDVVCCICDDGKSEPPDQIILCDVCNQGYHQKCHNPPVDSSILDESEETSDHKDWFCSTCYYILNQSERANMSATTSRSADRHEQQQQQQQQQQQSVERPKLQPQSPKQQPVKAKQPTTSSSSTVGPVKQNNNNVQRHTPYYPLSSQARPSAPSSSSTTAALASMTASSALVVGGTSGRTKQDLVEQSNRTSQKQNQRQISGSNPSPDSVLSSSTSPAKHAVRKSTANYNLPSNRQSALPTATRSTPPQLAPSPTSSQPKAIHQTNNHVTSVSSAATAVRSSPLVATTTTPSSNQKTTASKPASTTATNSSTGVSSSNNNVSKDIDAVVQKTKPISKANNPQQVATSNSKQTSQQPVTSSVTQALISSSSSPSPKVKDQTWSQPVTLDGVSLGKNTSLLLLTSPVKESSSVTGEKKVSGNSAGLASLPIIPSATREAATANKLSSLAVAKDTPNNSNNTASTICNSSGSSSASSTTTATKTEQVNNDRPVSIACSEPASKIAAQPGSSS